MHGLGISHIKVESTSLGLSNVTEINTNRHRHRENDALEVDASKKRPVAAIDAPSLVPEYM